MNGEAVVGRRLVLGLGIVAALGGVVSCSPGRKGPGAAPEMVPEAVPRAFPGEASLVPTPRPLSVPAAPGLAVGPSASPAVGPRQAVQEPWQPFPDDRHPAPGPWRPTAPGQAASDLQHPVRRSWRPTSDPPDLQSPAPGPWHPAPGPGQAVPDPWQALGIHPAPAPGPAATPATRKRMSARRRSGAGRMAREVSNGPRDRPKVALTFHGAGPADLAERVLSEAERHGAHLTVLAVGDWLARYPRMARRVLAGGHDLGNHTEHHLDISSMGEREAYDEIARCAARLRRLTGTIGSYFRPSRAHHATPMVRELAARVGYRTCLSYDVDSDDHNDPGVATVTANVLDTVRPGSIVSLHLGHPGTAEAMPHILRGLARRRLHPVTVTDLLAL
ncbi:polysaccharide deacetylase family protein [Streptosporangium sp. NPDC020072]|uniref:polysaccharide deacetylase family protein n=1 Tax=Streptosporangium sp. NPDC020072 TaxID=3154788 RepID=UPI003426734A